MSAPRTGKTLMMVCLAIRKGRKTLILAHQDDLCKQFDRTIRTFCHHVSRRSVQLVRESRQLWNGPVADITIATYQKLLRHTDRLDDIRDRWGCVMVDEVHRANANRYAEIVSRLGPRYMYGCSGTPARKERQGSHHAVRHGADPPQYGRARADPQGLRLQGQLTQSARQALDQHRAQPGERSEAQCRHHRTHHRRCTGRPLVVVPCTFRWYVDALVEEVNNAWFERTGRDRRIAAAFYRYTDKRRKEAVLDRARKGRIRVTVAIRSMLLAWTCRAGRRFTKSSRSTTNRR